MVARSSRLLWRDCPFAKVNQSECVSLLISMRDVCSYPLRRIDCSDSRPKLNSPSRVAVTGRTKCKCKKQCRETRRQMWVWQGFWNMDEMEWFLKARKNYKSCATTEYRWLFRGSPSSLRNLKSAVIKRPNLLARGGASPERFLQGALVILVLLQTSQFRSWWKWVKILCLLDATFLGGSESDSQEMFADAANSASSRLSVNSKHSRRSRKRLSAACWLSQFQLFWRFWGDHVGFPMPLITS